MKARKEGFIQELRPLLSEMKRNGFYISDGVEKFVLESAGEDKR
ncbi:MAG: DUF3368 domain-containing protein [Clostridiales bacterium]|nr:DUF3368 domain-containing protein [Clostridiales bacterium]